MLISGALVESDALELGKVTVFMTVPRWSYCVPMKQKRGEGTALIAVSRVYRISPGVGSSAPCTLRSSTAALAAERTSS